MNEREYQKQIRIIYAETTEDLRYATTFEEKAEVRNRANARLENLAEEYYAGGYY